MYLLKLIVRNLRRNLRRTALTSLTIALATFVYLVLVSVPGSMDRIVHDASATLRLIVINRNLPLYGMPARYCDQIREIPGAAACVAIKAWPATYQDVSDHILAVAEGLEIADVFPDYDLTGQVRRAFTRERRGAFAGHVLMSKYHWHPGQQVTLRGVGAGHLKLSFVLLGEMPSNRYPNLFAFRRDYLEEATRAAGLPNPDLAMNLAVRVDSAAQVAPLIREIDSTFRNSDFETRTVTESDALAGGLSILGNVRGIVLSLCVVVVLTVLLIAANSTAMTVRERMNEVGVMRTLGFGRGAVAAMLLGECGAQGALGGTVGAAAALAVFWGGTTMGAIGRMSALWVTPAGAAQAVCVAIAVGLLSGALPVFAALRIAPAIAIRHVG
ncbi:MAG TPA: ABC transporter permease [Candidatus Binataceae bacterium]|nr:ABC transporter permease [Candidatus Binataceae bacterium]